MPTGETYLSVMFFATGDCVDRDYYVTKIDLRKKLMGLGEGYSEKVYDPVKPSPGTMDENVLDKVCEIAESRQSSVTKIKNWFK